MNCGIYCIEHIESGKKYIGSSSDIARRWRDHKSELRGGRSNSTHLQHAWTKYGGNAFIFSKLLVCSIENLQFYEQICIDGYGVLNPDLGYNILPFARSARGMKVSAETREKMRANSTGRTLSEEGKAKCRAANLGRFVSAETRAKIRAKRALQVMPKSVSREVAELIAARYSAGKISQEEAGRPFGVHQTTVSKIARGEYYKDL